MSYILIIDSADPAGVLFSTTGPDLQWVGETALDRARSAVVESAYGETTLAGHRVCDQDITELHSAIRAARDRRCSRHPDEWARDGDMCEGCHRSADARDDAATSWDEADA